MPSTLLYQYGTCVRCFGNYFENFKQNFNKSEVCTLILDCSAAYEAEDCKCEKGKCVNKNLKNNGGCDEDDDDGTINFTFLNFYRLGFHGSSFNWIGHFWSISRDFVRILVLPEKTKDLRVLYAIEGRHSIGDQRIVSIGDERILLNTMV